MSPFPSPFFITQLSSLPLVPLPLPVPPLLPYGYHQQSNGAPQWPPQPSNNAPPASQQNGFPSPLQLPTMNLAAAPSGADEAAARRASGGSDVLGGGVKSDENGAAGSPNPAVGVDASGAGPSALPGQPGALPSVPADLYAHLLHQQQQQQHQPQHFSHQAQPPYFPPHLAAQYGLPSPAPYQQMMQQQQQMAAVAAAQRAQQQQQQQGGGTPVLGQGENVGAGGEVNVDGSEGKNGEYTPQDPYINSLRTSTPSAPPSNSTSPSLPSTSSAGGPAYPSFPTSLPPSLAAYTGLAPRPGAFPGIPGLGGLGMGGLDPYAAAAHLSGPPQQHPHSQQQHPLAHLQHPYSHPSQPPQQLQPGQPAGYKEGTPPDLPYASDDSADEDFGGGAGGNKGKGRASRGRARARKDSNNNTPSAVTPSGFAVPRPAGSSVVGADDDAEGPGTRDGSVDSSSGSGSRSRKRPAPGGSGGGTPLTVGGDADAEGSDVDPAVLAGLEPGQRLPGQGFAPPRARRQTEIPAVEDDPSVRPYGCNYCAPAGIVAPSTPQGQANSWRTIKELREHHTAAHKERQRQLEEAGDEAVMMEMPFRCALDPCGKTFKSLAGLRFHFQNASANGHFFVQLERDEDTGEERATKKFKQEVKPSGRELGCPVGRCPKRFKQSAGLAYHLSHTANHPITLSMLSTFEATLQSKTKWWFNRLGKEFAPEPGAAPAAPQFEQQEEQGQGQDAYGQQQQQQQAPSLQYLPDSGVETE
ncbi:hypothetical protein JCM11251_001361 [Rhodosporidiobolus azoricus]